MAASESGPPPPPLSFAALLGSTLEAMIHERLYARAVYPPDSFAPFAHLGVQCHASRVPRICEYVASFLRVAVPAVASSGARSTIGLIMEVLNNKGGFERPSMVERFVFQFRRDAAAGRAEAEAEAAADLGVIDLTRSPGDPPDQPDAPLNFGAELKGESMSRLELTMRECLLRLVSMRRRRRPRDEKAEDMSFRLRLRLDDEPREGSGGDIAEGGNGNVTSPDLLHVDDEAPGDDANGGGKRAGLPTDLMRQIKRGRWLEPEKEEKSYSLFSSSMEGSDEDAAGWSFRPVKDVDLPGCSMNLRFGMEVVGLS